MAPHGDHAGLDYVVLLPYNGTEATGGDSMTVDLNIYYNVFSSFPGFTLVSTHAKRRSSLFRQAISHGL